MRRKAKVIIASISIILALSITCALFLLGIIKINTPSLEEYPVRGVDVSEYQGHIDWQVIEQQDIAFAFIKASEGSGYTDPFFSTNWAEIESTSILYGAYHFFSFDSPALTQAENFLSTVGNRRGMLPPVVDIELYGEHKRVHPAPEAVRTELSVLLDALENYYGAKPIIYATQQSYKLYIDGKYTDYPIWIRDIYFTPNLPSGRAWDFWQYTDKGKLDGYSGAEQYIDINVFRGSLTDLEGMATG